MVSYTPRMDTAEVKKVFIRNLVFLMAQNGLSYADITKMNKRDRPVHGRYVSMLVKGERTPTIEVLASLGEMFGLSPTEMLNPTLPRDYAEENNLAEVVKHYLDANEEGRNHILSSAAIAPKK